MPDRAKRKSGGARKYKRNEEKCKRYALGRKRFKSKLKRIRQSNGDKAALAYQRGSAHASRYQRRHGEA